MFNIAKVEYEDALKKSVYNVDLKHNSNRKSKKAKEKFSMA